MAINDFLSGLLVKTGLKKTEVDKLKDEIAKHEDNIRTFNEKFSSHMVKIERIEGELTKLTAKYQAASGAIKETYAVQLKSLLKELKDTKETRDLLSRGMEQEKLLLRKQQQQLEFIQQQSTAETLETTIDDHRDMLRTLREEDRLAHELGTVSYTNENADDTTSLDAELQAYTQPAANDELDQLLAAFAAPASAPEAKPTTEA